MNCTEGRVPSGRSRHAGTARRPVSSIDLMCGRRPDTAGDYGGAVTDVNGTSGRHDVEIFFGTFARASSSSRIASHEVLLFLLEALNLTAQPPELSVPNRFV